MEKKKSKKNNGKKFENLFAKSCKRIDGLWYERFADSNKFGFSSATRFTTYSPADFLLFDWNRGLFYIELKSTEGSSFSIELEAPEKPCKGAEKLNKQSYMVKYHQLEGLALRHSYINIYGVVIFQFIDSGNCYWMFAENIIPLCKTLNKKSLNEKDISLHGYIIPMVKEKRTLLLDIEAMLEKMFFTK